MTKKSNETLYILQFSDYPLIKIGISTTLSMRINSFRTKYRTEFDLQNSTAVGCHSASKIKALEKELLSNSEEFSLKGDLLTKFGGLDGASEIREESCLPLLIKLIKYKAQLTGEFHVFNGISLERNLHSNLPLCIFNNNGETDYMPLEVSKIILNTIKSKVKDFEDFDYEEIVNRILSDYTLNRKILIETKKGCYSRKKKVHYANQFKTNNWYWMNPSSKLDNYKSNKEEE